MALNIDGPAQGRLSRAVESAFPDPTDLASALIEKLDDKISKYAPLYGGTYPQIRLKMIEQYNARYAIDALVVALLEQNPTNEVLLGFAWSYEIIKRPRGSDGKAVPGDDSLERMLDPMRGFSDPMAFLRRFGQITKCTCHIAVPTETGTCHGTGLLVGDETVLTNYHVVESLIKKAPGADAKDVRLLFDFHTGPDGQTLSSGAEYKLANGDDWLIAWSPYHADDLCAGDVNQVIASKRGPDALDFALVRVAGKPGAQPLGRKPGTHGALRGHIAIPADSAGRFTADFAQGTSALFIFQHPTGRPLQFDWMRPAVLGVNADRTRVLYNVNTEPGSSGSPCFNAKLELSALHHAGGKDWPAAAICRYNQGIPIDTIYGFLQSKNLYEKIV